MSRPTDLEDIADAIEIVSADVSSLDSRVDSLANVVDEALTMLYAIYELLGADE